MKVSDNKVLRYILQAFNYTLFMAIIWYFSNMPSFRQLGDDQAVLTIAFSHAGETLKPCRTLSPEELAALPPNMRKPTDCPRERSPVVVEAHMDGELIHRQVEEAPGLFKDSGVDIYLLRKIPAGKHQLKIQMDDSVRKAGFEHSFEQEITIEPAQILLVDFLPELGFMLK